MPTKKQVLNWLIAALVVETACATYGLRFTNSIPFLSVLYGVAGIAIALLWLLCGPASPSLKARQPLSPAGYGYRMVLLVILAAALNHFANTWFADNPLLVADADMLPIIRTMCQRLLQGHPGQVYDTIPNIWGGMKPIYLPAMWLPFSIAEWWHIDIRWTTVAIFFLLFGGCIWWVRSIANNLQLPWIILVGFALFWWLLTADNASGLLPYTEEGVVILFYVLLALALLHGNYWLIGVAVSCCVLSRYVLIGWLPALLLYLLLQKEYKNLFRLIISGIACFLLLMVLPFGWATFTGLVQLPSAYINFAARVWKDAPIVFSSSLGLAKFFGPQRIALQHGLLVLLSFTVPTSFLWVCWWLKTKRHWPLNHLLLATLKVALVIFYCLVDVPYLYLFYTSSFVSLVAILYFVETNNRKAKAATA